MNARILAATTTLAIAMVTSPLTARASTEQVEAFKKMLSHVPKLEMPARAAQEVNKAKANKRQVAKDMITAAIAISPASAPAVVRAISRVAPECAIDVVATASLLQPQQAMVIQAAMPIVSSAPMAGSPAFGGIGRAGEITPAGGGGPTVTTGGYQDPGVTHGSLPSHTAVVVVPTHDYSKPGW